jgi:secreted PhoX family phosphatase
MNNSIHRRTFLKFLGIGAGSLVVGLPLNAKQVNSIQLPFPTLNPSQLDTVSLAQGFHWEKFITWEDVINAAGETFGFNNDFIAFQSIDQKTNEGILLINHEYPEPQFVSGRSKKSNPTKSQVMLEQYAVGLSLIHVKQVNDGSWQIVKDSQYNRRVSGQTPIPLAWHEPIAGSFTAMGTVGNCAGGTTPWGTFLTCEENYDACYGEHLYANDGTKTFDPPSLLWHLHFPNPPEHYGWVVEVSPLTGESRKLIALGRCAHECATYAKANSGKAIIYSGDDANDECLYRFVADKENDLSTGEMFVANLEIGEWISLDINKQEKLKNHFTSQTEVLIRMREAAKILGGTPLARPEDITINPHNGDVIIALTNNKPKGNYYGSLLRLTPENGDHGATKFTSDTLIPGGESSGIACPDNLAFDANGNLWITTDMAGMHKDPYLPFGNNSLFVIPASGPDAGKAIRIANAPVDAEFTGPCFSPDGNTLFLSVQHPGELSPPGGPYTSHWPDGGTHIPKPAVIAISGPSLQFFTQKK